jgi:MFS family permease
MSDVFRFDVDDVGPDSETETDESDLELGESFKDGFSFTSLAILPFTVFAVYAFLSKSAVITALTALFGGASTAAAVVGTGLWVVGAIVVAAIGVLAFLSVASVLIGMVQRSRSKVGLGFLGGLYFGIGYVGAVTLFPSLPVLIGFMLTTTIVAWGAVLVIGGIGMLVALVIT